MTKTSRTQKSFIAMAQGLAELKKKWDDNLEASFFKILIDEAMFQLRCRLQEEQSRWFLWLGRNKKNISTCLGTISDLEDYNKVKTARDDPSEKLKNNLIEHREYLDSIDPDLVFNIIAMLSTEGTSEEVSKSTSTDTSGSTELDQLSPINEPKKNSPSAKNAPILSAIKYREDILKKDNASLKNGISKTMALLLGKSSSEDADKSSEISPVEHIFSKNSSAEDQSKGQTLESKVKKALAELYDSSADKLLDTVYKTSKSRFFWVSNEYKAVKALLDEVEKPESNDVVMQVQLNRLQQIHASKRAEKRKDFTLVSAILINERDKKFNKLNPAIAENLEKLNTDIVEKITTIRTEVAFQKSQEEEKKFAELNRAEVEKKRCTDEISTFMSKNKLSPLESMLLHGYNKIYEKYSNYPKENTLKLLVLLQALSEGFRISPEWNSSKYDSFKDFIALTIIDIESQLQLNHWHDKDENCEQSLSPNPIYFIDIKLPSDIPSTGKRAAIIEKISEFLEKGVEKNTFCLAMLENVNRCDFAKDITTENKPTQYSDKIAALFSWSKKEKVVSERDNSIESTSSLEAGAFEIALAEITGKRGSFY